MAAPEMTTTLAARDVSVTRQEFGATELRADHETAAAAVAAQAQAEIQARYIMAMRNPRPDEEEFRTRIINECKRKTFAEKAKYSRPQGREQNKQTGKWETKFIEGPSIRFVESALRCYKNVMTTARVTYESEDMRILDVTVTDLENNNTKAKTVTLHKSVERRGTLNNQTRVWEAPEGRRVLDERINSKGETTFLVEANEGELLAKEGALISKATRTLGQALLPADAVEDAMRQIERTLHDSDVQDPDAAKRQVIDGFNELNQGIGPKELAALLGHKLDVVSPSELSMLRKVYTAIKTGEATWQEIMEAAGSPEVGEGPEAGAGRATLADKLRRMQEDKKPNSEGAAAKENGPKQEAAPNAGAKPEPPAAEKEKPAESAQADEVPWFQGDEPQGKTEAKAEKPPKGSGFGKR